jgi:hypothetical protein
MVVLKVIALAEHLQVCRQPTLEICLLLLTTASLATELQTAQNQSRPAQRYMVLVFPQAQAKFYAVEWVAL